MLHGSLLSILVSPSSIAKALARGMALGLVFLADGYLYVLLARHVGTYLLLALAAALTLIETLAIYHNIHYEVSCAHARIREGRYPVEAFGRLLVRIIVALLFVVPGFASDAIAVLLLMPPLSWITGSVAERTHRRELQQVYEQVRLQS
ncbi:MAG: FxsA family protein [Spirochaetales bacterium]